MKPKKKVLEKKVFEGLVWPLKKQLDGTYEYDVPTEKWNNFNSLPIWNGKKLRVTVEKLK